MSVARPSRMLFVPCTVLAVACLIGCPPPNNPVTYSQPNGFAQVFNGPVSYLTAVSSDPGRIDLFYANASGLHHRWLVNDTLVPTDERVGPVAIPEAVALAPGRLMLAYSSGGESAGNVVFQALDETTGSWGPATTVGVPGHVFNKIVLLSDYSGTGVAVYALEPPGPGARSQGWTVWVDTLVGPTSLSPLSYQGGRMTIATGVPPMYWIKGFSPNAASGFAGSPLVYGQESDGGSYGFSGGGQYQQLRVPANQVASNATAYLAISAPFPKMAATQWSGVNGAPSQPFFFQTDSGSQGYVTPLGPSGVAPIVLPFPPTDKSGSFALFVLIVGTGGPSTKVEAARVNIDELLIPGPQPLFTPAYVSLGTGLQATAPVVVSSRPGRFDMFVLDTAGNVWRKWYDAGIGWQPSYMGP